MTQRTYAIGDIHGHLDRLREVHEWIEQDRDRADDVVVHVGDLTDRGPDSAGVLQFLMDGIAAGQPWVVIRGNHDRMMGLYLEEKQQNDPRLRPDYSWLHHRLGGLTTLASYGVLPMQETDQKRPRGAHWLRGRGGTVTSLGIDQGSDADLVFHARARDMVPVAHREFLAGLDTVYRTDDAVFVHAGIKPGVAIEGQDEDDLIWIREPFLSDERDHGPLIIHGHTPIDAPLHYGNRVNIDSGVAFGGPLTVVVVEGREVWNLTAAGREPLMPVSQR